MSLHQSSGRWRLGLVLSLLTLLLWGILPIALAVTLQSLDVYTVIWFRFLVSFVLLGIYLAMRGKLPKLEQMSSTAWKLLAIATLGLGGNYLLFMWGLTLTSPANAEVSIQISTLLFGFGGLVIFKERYQLYQWIGISVLIFGYVLFFNEQITNLITTRSNYILGNGLITLGAATWAVYALAQKQLLQSLSSTSIMLIIYGGCALLFTPFAKVKTIITVDSFHLGMLLFCGLNTLIAYGAFAESLEHWEASRVSAVLALAPIITLIAVNIISIIAPSLIPPERFTFTAILGAVLVVIGSMAIALFKTD
ncbi:DMT family transporter [Aetokthonos hydrillicola Thurmond2011]|jgi:drug/metabolite transporter (DMT)-like permease|uniref:DMT family transporter n=1 Tax=Aetokthonos hydrillicola Thurmond2011 TaxID=2712845 RepID=A0AAP5MB37_9CYAN|nr:DMT family transporter [Aetokthonos hydrillicola]MBO3457861.1 DMT family transporter [Aetokthonos hydrillicola CCALA 1050]MBW4587347.1 DMT family transporter [Aetokthonos hydrillicola CCALA 1050]MDR9896628.1 DMT family transporter [Aetokthonos hydrillicola Thurmond2011]